jgi:hypothetical protein
MAPNVPTVVDPGQIFAALRKSQQEVMTLKQGLREVQALLAKNANAPKWIEDLPGKRVQYEGVIDVDIPAQSLTRVEGSYPVSTDGPFVITSVAMFYQRKEGPYAGVWGPASMLNSKIDAGLSGVGFLGIYDQPVVGSFNVEFAESGSDRNWQNNSFSSALFAPSVGGVYVLPVGALIGRSGLVLARVTPTVAQEYEGQVQIILLGYKIVQGDSYQP